MVQGAVVLHQEFFNNCVESIPIFSNGGLEKELFMFNHIIVMFGVPREIITYHGTHFQNFMMVELAVKLGLN